MTDKEADGKEGIYSLQPARDAALEVLRAEEKLAYTADRNKFAAAALTGMLAGNVMADIEGEDSQKWTVHRMCDDAVFFGNGMMRAIERNAAPQESVENDNGKDQDHE